MTNAIHLEFCTLAAALPPSAVLAPGDAELPDAETLRVVLDELDSLLAESDTAAIDVFERQAAALTSALGSSCDELGRQIGQFAFATAREILRDLRVQSGQR